MKIKQAIKKFYNNQAEKFSQTRNKHWPEFNYIFKEIEKLLTQKDKIKILDLWCGDWRLYWFLAENFSNRIDYVGVDISEKLIQIAIKKYKWKIILITPDNLYLKSISKNNNIICDKVKKCKRNNQDNLWLSLNNNYPLFIVSDMLDYLENIDPETFDFVVSVASFQHIPTNWERLLILKHIYRVLKYNWKIMMFNWSFSEWFFKKYKWQILKSFILWILSLGSKHINDIMVPWKDKNKIFYRYYHIFFLFELKKLFKQAWFVIKEICYINRRWEKTVSRIDSRNSCVIWVKNIVR